MCDTFVVLSAATQDGSIIFGKSADCQVNEAHALVQVPARKHSPGAAFRATHLVIPQAAETYSVLLSKAFWTWGCEMGVNEHGLAMGNEAVFSARQRDEQRDGLIGMDLMRLALERARTCREAIDVVGMLLHEYGQGGNCELSGNSHFDSSFIVADASEAWVLETAGREWAAKQVATFQSISNFYLIGTDWDLCSLDGATGKVDWAQAVADLKPVSLFGAHERQSATHCALEAAAGAMTVRSAFDLLRQHGSGFHPARDEFATTVCMHTGPGKWRQSQAVGAMITKSRSAGTIAWVTGTAGTCVSIFKPVFVEVEWSGLPLPPTEQYDPQSLWWKHELLHRRAMAAFETTVPDIREDFDGLEREFLATAETVLTGTPREKQQFMEHCFQAAECATDQWIFRLSTRADLAFTEPDYYAIWQRHNSQAGIPEPMPLLA